MEQPLSPIASWSEDPVDRRLRHFELRFGPYDETHGWDESQPVALVGPPLDGCVNVQFLVCYNAAHEDEIASVVREIEFYLIQKGERDPWRYAQYHCGTMANFYSDVHWGYIVPDLDHTVDTFSDGLKTFGGFTRHCFTVGELRDDSDWQWGFDDGVYCFVVGERVEYVGRSLGSTLGRRIVDQLRAQEDPQWAQVVNDRDTRVVVFAVEPGQGHFASALEAYLIDCLDPTFNSRSQ